MPSTYTSSNRFEKPGLLEQDGTWGTTLNTDYDLIDAAISGFTTIAMSDANYSLTVVSGSADQARLAYLNFTGTLTATRTITVPAVSKIRVVANNTTQSLIFSTGSGTTLTVAAGLMSITCCDGTNVKQVSSSTTDAATLNGQAGSYYQNASNLNAGTVANARLTAGTTSTAGILQLTDSVASNSTTTAATPNSVLTTYTQATLGVTNAATAQATANSAQSTANTAQTSANTAQSTANNATTLANNAQSTANTANSNASTAQATANNALSTFASYLPNIQNSNVNQRGYVYGWNGTASVTLPAGGTWFVATTFYASGGNCVGGNTTYQSGGTAIFVAGGGTTAIGWAIRVS